MIVVGYSADRYGTAALEHGIAEAKRRDTNLLVINATTGEALSDPRFAQAAEVHDVEEHLNECGVDFELNQPVGVDPADLDLSGNDDVEPVAGLSFGEDSLPAREVNLMQVFR